VGVERGELTSTILRGGNGCAALKTDILLQPGEEREITVLLGFANTLEEAKAYRESHSNRDKVYAALEAVKSGWEHYTDAYRLESPDPLFNAMINCWNQYQCKTTFDWSRYISFYENGEGRGMGTRDSSQDTLAVCAQLTDRVHRRILEILGTTQLRPGIATTSSSPWATRAI
jgi:cellobiose phosphorylase